MLDKVQKFMRENQMLQPGDRVVAGVSGGADSVCLLYVLCRTPGVRVRAVHVHHGLRGAEADRDEQYVRELCAELDVPLTVVHCRVAEYAKEHGLSTEEAGRVLRYRTFEEEAARWQKAERRDAKEYGECSGCSISFDGLGADGACEKGGETGTDRENGGIHHQVKIAVAHHQDDSAETILYHLLRGSGLKGLSGIRPVQGNRIRPLLCVSREEIRDFLTKEGIRWCEDSTNADSDYTRNRIRNQILPLLKEQVNARAEENILRAGEIFAQADEYLEAQAEKLWEEAGSCVREQTTEPDLTETREQTAEPDRADVREKTSEPRAAASTEFPLSVFSAQPPIIRTYLIRRMLDLVTPGWKDITSRHFAQIMHLADGNVGAQCDLPGELRAVRTYDTLRLERKTAPEITKIGRIQPGMLEFSIIEGKNPGDWQEIPKNQYTKWFDYDKIKDTLSVRYRETGDYLTLPGGGRKTVARYMIDEKIPRDQRDEIPVLAEGSHILWVVGYRISEYYKITDTTKKILQVKVNGGEEHGR